MSKTVEKVFRKRKLIKKMSDIIPKLDNWAVVYTGDPYRPPELQRGRLTGIVSGHPSISDGSEVTTSCLEGAEERANGKCFAKTASGSTYELGTAKESYEAAFPNALKRILEAFKKT